MGVDRTEPKTKQEIEQERNSIDEEYEKYVDQHGTSEDADNWRDAAHQSIEN
jgi:hypothetical protein